MCEEVLAQNVAAAERRPAQFAVVRLDLQVRLHVDLDVASGISFVGAEVALEVNLRLF